MDKLNSYQSRLVVFFFLELQIFREYSVCLIFWKYVKKSLRDEAKAAKFDGHYSVYLI